MEGWDWVPASVIYGTVVGGFMFGFVRLVAKAFMRSGETRPPNGAGTLSSLVAIRRTDWLAQLHRQRNQSIVVEAVAPPPPLVTKNGRQGLRFGATNIVLNESFARWLWRLG